MLIVRLEMFQIYSKVHSCDDYNGQMPWPALLALGDTYVYHRKEGDWVYEISSPSLSRFSVTR